MLNQRNGLLFSVGFAITLLLAAGWGAAPLAAQQATPGPAAEIQALLAAQSVAWNRGDIDGFMAGYWKSEKTTFAGSNGVSRGWQMLRDRYRRNYPDRATMGTLEFANLEVTELAPDAALVLGHWHIERASGPVGGVFSLVVRKFPEGWRVIHDHTSAVQ